MNPYSSSLNDAQWAVVEPLLDELLPKKKQTCPHKWSNRLLFDAMLYQLKNGCHWTDLPKDFPRIQQFIGITSNGGLRELSIN
jgi:transposase